MDRKLIITDLTRFNEKNENVCMAGIDVVSGECIRPFRYLTKDECKKHNILPGSILRGQFEKSAKIDPPHTEDNQWSKLNSEGHCTSDEFLGILESSDVNDLQNGFGVKLDQNQKHIPSEFASMLKASIITLGLLPQSLSLVEDSFKKGEIRVHIKDKSGWGTSFLSLTDLGYYNYIKNKESIAAALRTENEFIHNQERLFVRVGLSRYYEVKDRKGFWIQINGIYTFPNYNTEIRSYK